MICRRSKTSLRAARRGRSATSSGFSDEFPDAQPALGYGLTETNAIGCTNFWGNYADKPASTGRAQSRSLKSLSSVMATATCRADEVGEIAIRTAANMKGYWRNPEATADAFTGDGFVRTGDIGYLDEDGYLFIVDRKKEIIIRGGENISAAEVEAELYACDAVAEVSSSERRTNGSAKFPLRSSIRNGGEMKEEDLRAFLDGRLAKFKIPERILFVDAPLPKLGTGKIDRRALKAQYTR